MRYSQVVDADNDDRVQDDDLTQEHDFFLQQTGGFLPALLAPLAASVVIPLLRQLFA